MKLLKFCYFDVIITPYLAHSAKPRSRIAVRRRTYKFYNCMKENIVETRFMRTTSLAEASV